MGASLAPLFVILLLKQITGASAQAFNSGLTIGSLSALGPCLLVICICFCACVISLGYRCYKETSTKKHNAFMINQSQQQRLYQQQQMELQQQRQQQQQQQQMLNQHQRILEQQLQQLQQGVSYPARVEVDFHANNRQAPPPPYSQVASHPQVAAPLTPVLAAHSQARASTADPAPYSIPVPASVPHPVQAPAPALYPAPVPALVSYPVQASAPLPPSTPPHNRQHEQHMANRPLPNTPATNTTGHVVRPQLTPAASNPSSSSTRDSQLTTIASSTSLLHNNPPAEVAVSTNLAYGSTSVPSVSSNPAYGSTAVLSVSSNPAYGSATAESDVSAYDEDGYIDTGPPTGKTLGISRDRDLRRSVENDYTVVIQ